MNKYLSIQCKDCENKQIIYDRATTKVKCEQCKEQLSTPKGGKCELINCRVIEVIR